MLAPTLLSKQSFFIQFVSAWLLYALTPAGAAAIEPGSGAMFMRPEKLVRAVDITGSPELSALAQCAAGEGQLRSHVSGQWATDMLLHRWAAHATGVPPDVTLGSADTSAASFWLLPSYAKCQDNNHLLDIKEIDVAYRTAVQAVPLLKCATTALKTAHHV